MRTAITISLTLGLIVTMILGLWTMMSAASTAIEADNARWFLAGAILAAVVTNLLEDTK